MIEADEVAGAEHPEAGSVIGVVEAVGEAHPEVVEEEAGGEESRESEAAPELSL